MPQLMVGVIARILQQDFKMFVKELIFTTNKQDSFKFIKYNNVVFLLLVNNTMKHISYESFSEK